LGDDHGRTLCRQLRQTPTIAIDPDLEPAHSGLSKALARARSALVLEIDPLQARLARDPLDRADHQAFERRILRVGIADSNESAILL